MSTTDSIGRLVRLGETDWTVADPAADVRGRTVFDTHGEEVGTVEDLLVDDQERRVRLLRIGSGGFLGIGRDHVLVPVDAVTAVSPDGVTVSRERDRLRNAPVYDPDLTDDPAAYADLYGWWGVGPYWTAGYVYPGYPYYR